MKHLDRFFRLSQREATLAGEIRGGCTTFCSMVYLILVIPGLLSGVGMDFGQAMTAACLIAADENLVDMGSLAAPEPLLALLGIFLTAVLVMKKVPGALMLGMALTVVLGIPLGVTVLPQALTAPPELSLATLKPDFTGLLALGPVPLVSVLLSLLVSQYFDALGTLLGVARDAKLTDVTGDLAGQRGAMVCCGAATCAGALLGVSNVTAMAESATGIREGARTGLSAVVTGLLFLCLLPLTPLAEVVTSAALAAPLVMVGMSMMSGITQITWKHVEISLPSFLMIVGMPFTFSITTGVMLGWSPTWWSWCAGGGPTWWTRPSISWLPCLS